MTWCITDSSCIQLLSNNKIEWNFKHVNIVTIHLKGTDCSFKHYTELYGSFNAASCLVLGPIKPHGSLALHISGTPLSALRPRSGPWPAQRSLRESRKTEGPSSLSSAQSTAHYKVRGTRLTCLIAVFGINKCVMAQSTRNFITSLANAYWRKEGQMVENSHKIFYYMSAKSH